MKKTKQKNSLDDSQELTTDTETTICKMDFH